MNDQRRVTIGDRSLWAERLGDPARPTVLLLAGAAMQATSWEDQFVGTLLSAGRGVIRFDWRDIGRSSWVRFRDQPYSIDDLAQDAHVVLDEFGVNEADVVGFSMGGCVAQIMALSAPDRLRSLTLLSSGFASPIEVNMTERGRRLLEVLQAPAATDHESQIHRQVAQWRLLCGRAFRFDENEWVNRARSWIQRGQNPKCPHVRLGTQVFGVDRTEQLRRLKVPTYVVHGDDDPMFPLPHGKAIANTIPSATLSVLSGRGHDLFLDAEVASSTASNLG